MCFEKDEPVLAQNIVGWVVGDPDRSEDVWRVQFNPHGSTAFRELAVEVAWL